MFLKKADIYGIVALAASGAFVYVCSLSGWIY